MAVETLTDSVTKRRLKKIVMEGANDIPPASNGRLWVGGVMSLLSIAFLTLDAIIKFVKPEPVVEAFTRLGYPIHVAVSLGIVLLVCTALYAIPRTSVLGAILLTGYLGGAVATHLRVGDPLFSHILFPCYLGILIWGGLYLRDATLRLLIPSRS
jgi:hypothetical protein